MSENFDYCFNKMIDNEGGYVDHTVKGDRGGQTYAGVARKFHPSWAGWEYIDKGDYKSAKVKVKEFYYIKFWPKIKGNQIECRDKAFLIFDFAVNAGYRTALKLAQAACNMHKKDIDGVMGPKTLEIVNSMEGYLFKHTYTCAKIERYRAICMNDKSQKKFLLGWINRTMGVLSELS